MSNVDETLLRLFVSSMEENIDTVDSKLIELENKSQDLELINSIMRAFHSLKGSSGLVGFTRMKELTHEIETVMVDIRAHKIEVTRPLISLLLDCVNRIKTMKEEFLKGNMDTEISDIVERVQQVRKEGESTELPPDTGPTMVTSQPRELAENTPRKTEPEKTTPVVELDQESMNLYISDLEEDIERIDSGLLELENKGHDLELINSIMRAAHNIKGSSSMVGFGRMKELTHAVEAIMVKANEGNINIDRPLISLLLTCMDRIRMLKEEFRQGCVTTDTSDLVQEISERLRQTSKGDRGETGEDKVEPENNGQGISVDNREKPENTPVMELDQESMNLYISDLEEDIERIDKGLLELESKGQSPELVNSIMRSAHNIKGSSSMVGFGRMKELTHAIESVMVKVNNGDINIDRPLISLLLESMDSVRLLKEEFAKEKIQTEVDQLVQKLRGIKKEIGTAEEKRKPLDAAVQTPVNTKPVPTELPKEKFENVQNVKIRVKSIEEMVNQISEMVICQTRLMQINKSLRRQYMKEPKFKEAAQFLEIIGKTIGKLQDELMQSRMITMDIVFKNFPRMVRDLELSLQKNIELIIENSQTRLDKNIAEEITNPLVHIIRNSADHGIELPEERLKAGKPERGTIRISTWQKSEQIIISVEDDGKGIDEEKVLASAIKKGLITQEKAKELSRQEAVNMIFHPGFSTAEKVSDVSGRGVGMDVVKTHIEKINGTVEIVTEKGKGTKITLKVPSTMSVVPCIITEINTKMLCLPSINVNKVLTITANDIKKKESKEIVVIDDVAVPLIRLHEKFEGTPRDYRGKYYVVILGLVEKRAAILVDRLLGSQKVIVRPLANYLGEVHDIAGTTILEDGKIGFVLDVAEIVSSKWAV